MITTAVCKFCGQVFAAPSGVQTEAEADGEAAETENGILEILNSAIEYMAYSKINSITMIVPRIGKVALRADGSSIKIKRSQTFVCESKV